MSEDRDDACFRTDGLGIHKENLRVTVIQLGSRMHYAVPLAFHRANILERMITDITSRSWPCKISSLVPFKMQPRVFRRLSGRIPKGIPLEKIQQYPTFGLGISLLRLFATRLGRIDRAYLAIGRAFAKLAAASVPSETNVIYGFNGASLEAFRSSSLRETYKVLEQTMAPRLVEDRLLSEAHEKYAGWADKSASKHGFFRPALYRREAEEWQAADIVVCGSRFVVDGIAEAGGPVSKCVVVPYGVDHNSFPGRAREIRVSQPLNVLFVGAVTLRKGAPLVLEAARMLGDEVRIRMIGAIEIPADKEAEMRRYVELVGPVPRSEMRQHFDWADIFLLPSFCEGSATVTYEAMASGLPQIVTTNTGAYVEDGEEGMVVPPNDPSAIATALRAYIADPQRYAHSSKSALATAQCLSIDKYRERLVSLVSEKNIKIL